MKKLVFSSDDIPAHLDDSARFRCWRDVYIGRFGDAEFSYGGEKPFQARSEFARIGNVEIARIATTLQGAGRTSRQVAADPREDLLIGFNRSARRKHLVQRGREVSVPAGTGGAAAFTNAEPVTTSYGNGEMAIVGISVPFRLLRHCISYAEDAAATVLVPSPAVIHLGRYLDFLFGAGEIDFDPLLQGQVETTLVDLAVLALGTGGEAAEIASSRGLRAARRREIVAMIHSRYATPEFSSHEVGRKLGLSQRYVQELLQEAGLTFSERVLELRLQKVCVMLADRHNDRLKISEIAHACGFTDISYFNQAFRRRFGAAPSHFRSGSSGG